MQPNKAIVGRNAFAHEAGIHQDGVLKERATYEIMDATTVGLRSNSIVLGKHSGRHALRKALEEMGFEIDGQALNIAFKRFKEIADRKKQVTAMDLEALVTDELREEIAGYTLEWFEVEASSRRPPHARVVGDAARRQRGRRARSPATVRSTRSSRRSTPPPAIARRSSATSRSAPSPRARTRSARSRSWSRSTASTGAGQGVSTDIIDAAARAYVRALSVARGPLAGAARRSGCPSRRRRAPPRRANRNLRARRGLALP